MKTIMDSSKVDHKNRLKETDSLKELNLYQHHTHVTSSKVSKLQDDIVSYKSKIEQISMEDVQKINLIEQLRAKIKQHEQIVISNIKSKQEGVQTLPKALKSQKPIVSHKIMFSELDSLRSEKNMYHKINNSILHEISKERAQINDSADKLSEILKEQERVKRETAELEEVCNECNKTVKDQIYAIQKQIREENLNTKSDFSASSKESKKLNTTNKISVKSFTGALLRSKQTLKTDQQWTEDRLEQFKEEKETLQDNLNETRNILEMLFKETQCPNVDALISYLNKLEDVKTRLYTETRLMIDEIEKLKEMSVVLSNEIQQRTHQQPEITEQKLKMIETIKEENQVTEIQIKKLNERISEKMNQAKFLGYGLLIVLERASFTRFEREKIKGLPVSNDHIIVYLDMLERKTNYLLKTISDRGLKNELFNLNGNNDSKSLLDDRLKENEQHFEEMIRSKIRKDEEILIGNKKIDFEKKVQSELNIFFKKNK